MTCTKTVFILQALYFVDSTPTRVQTFDNAFNLQTIRCRLSKLFIDSAARTHELPVTNPTHFKLRNSDFVDLCVLA